MTKTFSSRVLKVCPMASLTCTISWNVKDNPRNLPRSPFFWVEKFLGDRKNMGWLVVSIHLKKVKVNWDDDIPNIWKHKHGKKCQELSAEVSKEPGCFSSWVMVPTRPMLFPPLIITRLPVSNFTWSKILPVSKFNLENCLSVSHGILWVDSHPKSCWCSSQRWMISIDIRQYDISWHILTSWPSNVH